MPDLHFKILPDKQKKAWKALVTHKALWESLGYYLAGGTALALQLGHRHSIDFDFFSKTKDTAEKVIAEFEGTPDFIVRESDVNTVHGELGGVKISIIGGYKYDTVEELIRTEDGIYLATVKELAAMKLLAITHRATIRDYLDLAVIIRDVAPLKDLLAISSVKYGDKFNIMIPLRALSSFDDLEGDLPIIHDAALLENWQNILKQAVEETAKSILLDRG